MAALTLQASLLAACFTHAAATYNVPEPVLTSIAQVEGGASGTVSRNANGTRDLGVMQVNDSWIASLVKIYENDPHFIGRNDKEKRTAVWSALVYDDCFNISIGAWILKRGFDEAKEKGGGFWSGVGYYHSHTPHHMANYQQMVARAAVKLYGNSIIASSSKMVKAPTLPDTAVYRKIEQPKQVNPQTSVVTSLATSVVTSLAVGVSTHPSSETASSLISGEFMHLRESQVSVVMPAQTAAVIVGEKQSSVTGDKASTVKTEQLEQFGAANMAVTVIAAKRQYEILHVKNGKTQLAME